MGYVALGPNLPWLVVAGCAGAHGCFSVLPLLLLLAVGVDATFCSNLLKIITATHKIAWHEENRAADELVLGLLRTK